MERFRLLVNGVASLISTAERGDAPPPPSGVAGDQLVYAVGDVHGCLPLLEDLLGRIQADAAGMPDVTGKTLIFLGDYVDRGPDSAGVLDRLSLLSLPGFTVRYLVGNHELAMLDFLRDPIGGRDWLKFGGIATLVSYGVVGMQDIENPVTLVRLRDDLRRRLPTGHLAFLEALLPMAVIDDYAFVHAGIRPGIPLDEQTLDDLCWIRETFLASPNHHGKRIVHGHSITPFPEVRGNRIGVDTGAYAGGPLTALVLKGTSIRFIQARTMRTPAVDG